MIRRAKISEIDDILQITKACADLLIKNNIFQWNENYPSRKDFEKDVQRNELYLSIKKGHLIGGIVLSDLMDEEYLTIKWRTKNIKNLYIHRLFVDPNYQRQGHAQKLMAFAEAYAKQNGFVSIRLDTFSQNQRNQRFYETRGYQKLGDIFLPQQSKYPFHCYELVL